MILKGKKLEIDKSEIFLVIVLLRGSHSLIDTPPPKMQYVTVFVVRLANNRSEKRLKGHFSHPRCRLHQTELN